MADLSILLARRPVVQLGVLCVFLRNFFSSIYIHLKCPGNP